MKKSDLKQLIKPLVKECIHEVLIEEGHLAQIVTEVSKGMQGNLVVEKQQKRPETLFTEDLHMKRKSAETKSQLKEHRQKLMDSIGSEAYNGVNLFEGVEPLSRHETSEPSPGAVDLGSPRDAGVDISSLVGGAAQVWKAIK